MESMLVVYVLRLTNNKYYIGKCTTQLLESHFQEHLAGRASAWTKRYKPLCIEKIFNNVNIYDDDKYTVYYMSTFGIDNVRGGSYTQVNLTDSDKRLLTREMWNAQGLCTNCGNPGHLNCLSEQYDSDSEYSWYCDNCDEEFDTEQEAKEHEKKCCKA